MEMPDLQAFGMDAGKITRDDIDQWAVIGERLWHRIPGTPGIYRVDSTGRTAYQTFDDRSLILIAWLHDLGQPKSSDADLTAMIGRLEYSVIADTALDELQLRQQIRAKLVSEPALSFDALNAWIYADVFHTPKSDPWLGLVPRTDFSGLPGDGVVAP